MFNKKSTSSDTVVVAGITAVIAGVAGFLAGRRNHAERTAEAERRKAQFAADRAEALLANKRYIEETIVVQAKARAQERSDAERLAALTPAQRRAFEEERAHDEKVALENRRLQSQLDLARQTAQALLDVESRKAKAQQDLVRTTQQLREDVIAMRRVRKNPFDLVWQNY